MPKLTVITTHISPDFDALASMLAAQKLYPDAVVARPEIYAKTARKFFLETVSYLFNLSDVKSIETDDIKRLVVVDTRSVSRVGGFADLIGKPGVEVHLYDHHPDETGDIRADFEVHETVGATVSILVRILREKKIQISAEEATVMCLGIFEDTGSFTFSSTTELDFLSAAWLRRKGAGLSVISHLLSKEIEPEQVILLNYMIKNAKRHIIKGLEIIVTTVTMNEYVRDLAYLVFKFSRMEHADAIFAVASMNGKIYVTARSGTPDADVGEILSELGGGGHAYAAAATIKGKTCPQVEQELLSLLGRMVKPARLARDLMSSPAITVRPEVTCVEAATLLTKYNINALVVSELEHGIPVGFITRQTVEKALFHNLQTAPVSSYMNVDPVTTLPQADLFDIQTKILEYKQRIIPVVDGDRLLGVITRTDLLDSLMRQSLREHGEKRKLFYERVGVKRKKMAKMMKARLSEKIFEFLQKAGSVAEKCGFTAYVVGGFIRDMILCSDVREGDLDLVVEGDGIIFARRFVRKYGGMYHKILLPVNQLHQSLASLLCGKHVMLVRQTRACCVE